MAMRLAYQADVQPWLNSFRGARERLQDATPAWRQVGEVLLGAVTRNFDEQGQPPGSWPDLSEATLLARAAGRSGKGKIWKGSITTRTRRSGGITVSAELATRRLTKRAATRIAEAKALVWSGRLLRSIAYQAMADAAEVGSNLVYAARQFFGSRPGVKPVTPARNPFGLTERDEYEIERILIDFIVGGMT